MRDPKRIPEILSLLEEVWTKYPDLRLGQILHCLNDTNSPLFYIEDVVILKKLKTGDLVNNIPKNSS